MATNKILLGRNIIVALVCHFVELFVLALLLVLVPCHNDSIALSLSFGGYCTSCNVHHVLPTTDEAKQAAVDLRDRIIQSGRIDIDELPTEERQRLLSSSSVSKYGENAESLSRSANDTSLYTDLDPLLATERLYERRGKMFGVLVCETPDISSGTFDATPNPSRNQPSIVSLESDVVILKAYAGKLGGQWNLPGWAPLVGKIPESIPEFRQKSAEVTELFEKIEKLSQEKGKVESEESAIISEQIKELTKERSRLSTLCIDELRKHQVMQNFRGIRMPIKETFAKGPTKLPGGTGDCAAPKLVAQAVKLGLKPTGICEIFIGETGGMSTTKGDGNFYEACEPRCQQIAGYMLCGLET